MSFLPSLPLGGVGGWALLQRIEDGQRETFARRPDVAREAAYFEENVGSAATAAELVSDRRVLRVALTAFGLEDEIDKRALLRKVLESNSADRESFANRLVDARYAAFAKAFGYGDLGGARVSRTGFAQEISASYKEKAFESALGESDPSMRLALNARRELQGYAASNDPNNAAWFALLGDKPVRAVIEGGFGLPDAFGSLDIDRQRSMLQEKTRELFGEESLAVFNDPDNVETLIRRFLFRETALNGPTAQTRGVGALAILQGGLGAAGLGNLLLARST